MRAQSNSIWNLPNAHEMLLAAVEAKKSSGDTARELSAHFGVEFTRNACISRATRLGNRFDSNHYNNRPRGANVSSLRSSPKKKPVVVNHKPAAEIPPKPVAVPVIRRVSLVELTHSSCRWPLGDPRDADFAFCGADRVKPDDESNVYCAGHAGVAYRPQPTRQITPEHRRAMLAGKLAAKRWRAEAC